MAEKIGQRVISWLGDAVRDLSSLQVETYKVDLTAEVEGSGKVGLDEFIDNLTVKVNTGENTLKVVMVTQSKFDHDTVVLVSSELEEGDEALIEQHHAILAAASKARSDVIELALRFAKGEVLPAKSSQ